MSTTALVCVLMPIPGALGAPVFNGDHASDFLVLVEQLGMQAGITDKDLLVEWIVCYPIIDIHDTIQWMKQFDPDEAKKTWEAATKCLKSLYTSRDKAPQVTCKDLENFLFTSSDNVDNYQIKFSKFSAPLIKNKKITKEERNYCFVTGLLNATLEWFHNQLDPKQRYVNSAPLVEDAVKVIKQQHDHNTIFYKPWTTSTDKTKHVRFDLDGQWIDPNEETDSSTQNKKESSNPSSSIDELAKHFKDIVINFLQAMIFRNYQEITREELQPSSVDNRILVLTLDENSHHTWVMLWDYRMKESMFSPQTYLPCRLQILMTYRHIRLCATEETLPKAQKPIEVVPPKNPINHEEGWKVLKPSNNKGKEREKDDVLMKDGTGKPGPSYHLTSTLSEKTQLML
ncbi:hypothetical protein K435DRAFT_791964 [Dendrothele bispora CBS 962.96]|uniref:DUF4100 domain-containing protein n=1 Tax=Dendrothele bispora (strain CBS 962.96) TaxID=1314807 RepID=A0A4S8MKD9_DENBC|nr:hypothetical protein K435DRAFT_791964 [Dendrothele bispora CBS 962.96]